MRSSIRSSVCLLIAALGATGCGAASMGNDENPASYDAASDARATTDASGDTGATRDGGARDASSDGATLADVIARDVAATDSTARDATSTDVITAMDAVARDATSTRDATVMDTSVRDAVAIMDTSVRDVPVATDAPRDAVTITDAAPSSSRLTARPLGSTTATQGFWEYLPPGYDGTTPTPILIALHGIGENGDGSAPPSTTGLQKMLSSAIPKLINNDRWPADRPFIVLAPQHSGSGCPSSGSIHTFIAWALANYPVDTHRVYLTGLSCGAIGAWNYVGQYLDEYIAAYVPIAGDARGAWTRQGCNLGRLPIWDFHGDADGTVPVTEETVPMANLAACTNPAPVDATMTVYPGVGHDSWTRTYDLSAGHDVFTWMLSHTH